MTRIDEILKQNRIPEHENQFWDRLISIGDAKMWLDPAKVDGVFRPLFRLETMASTRGGGIQQDDANEKCNVYHSVTTEWQHIIRSVNPLLMSFDGLTQNLLIMHKSTLARQSKEGISLQCILQTESGEETPIPMASLLVRGREKQQYLTLFDYRKGDSGRWCEPQTIFDKLRVQFALRHMVFNSSIVDRGTVKNLGND